MLRQAVAVLTILMTGCTSPNVILERTVAVDTSLGYAQAMIAMKEGDRLQWSWTVENGQAIHFNTHDRDPYKVLKSQDGPSGKGDFVAPHDDSFAFYWDPDRATADKVTFVLSGDGTVDTTGRIGQNVPPL